jgi:CBS domain-containing protein
VSAELRGPLERVEVDIDQSEPVSVPVHPLEVTAEPVAVSAATPIEAAVTLMTEYGFHHLPVVDGERPTGMLGLRQAARKARGRTGIGLGF